LIIDWDREIITYVYFGYRDLISQLGGMKSAYTIVFQIPLPFFMLAFLISLADIIQQQFRTEYKSYLLVVIHNYFSKIKVKTVQY
jgi:hypothetical protein